MFARRFCVLCYKELPFTKPFKTKRLCTSSSRTLTNSEVRKKRNVLFDDEKNRQLAFVKRIEKIKVEYKGLPENCTLLMNKNLSTPYNCAMRLSVECQAVWIKINPVGPDLGPYCLQRLSADHTNMEEFIMKRSVLAMVNGHPWDMHRPLEDDCEIEFLHMLDENCDLQNKVFWRTCSFLLGHMLETSFKDDYYVELCSFPRPNVESGNFVYDADLKLPHWNPTERELLCLSLEISQLIAKDCHFERLNVSEDIALKIFEDNRFKSEQIPKVAEQSYEKGTVMLYRVGDHIDICRGPLISTTGQIGRFSVTSVHDIESEKYGKLKRVQGIALPTDLRMHSWSYDLLRKHAKKLNKAPIPGTEVQQSREHVTEPSLQQATA